VRSLSTKKGSEVITILANGRRQDRLPGFDMPKEYEVAWLTPPAVMSSLEEKFGKFDFDPSPFPRPQGFDGLIADWGINNYLNPPFKFGAKGIISWVRKAVAEQAKGNSTLLVWPVATYFDLLVQARAEMQSLGVIEWMPSDGSNKKPMHWPIVAFYLRGGQR